MLEQQFVKDPESTIRNLLEEVGADIVQFVRYEVGEGIEKEEEYFNIATARIESVETKSTLEGFYD